MSKKFLQVGLDGLQEEILGYSTDEFIDSSAGVADAGKPIKLDAAGKVDSSMIDFGAIDHGQLSGLLDDDHTQYTLADGTRAFTGDQSMGANKITNLADPSVATDAANKQYVDSVASGLQIIGNVRVAVSTNIDLSSMPASVDGVALSNGDRFLAFGQTDDTENGVYVFNGAAVAAVRSEDQDNSPLAEIVNGTLIPLVIEGTNADKPYVITSQGTGVNGQHQIGVDSIIFQQYSIPTELSAGLGIDAAQFASKIVQMDLLASGGLKFTGQEVGVEPADFSGEGLFDDGSDNLAIDWSTLFNDAKAVKAEDLNSTVAGKGASIIGIEDSAGYYTGTNTEAVLVELKDQLGADTSSTHDFSEENVLADNDSVYGALEKLDLRFGDLSSAAPGEGASIIAIEDAAGKFDATTVEGALLELSETTSGIEYTVGAGGVTKGHLVFISANDTVSTYSNLSQSNRGLGLALTTEAAAATVISVRNDTVIEGALVGATAGDPYYWDGSGLTTSIPSGSGSYVWQVGIAKNATDLAAEVRFVKKNA